MDEIHDPLLGEVEAFLSRTGMTPTAFGAEAVKDPRFVFELRAGRECRRSTRQKVVQFMRQKRAAQSLADVPAKRRRRSAA